MLRKCLTFPSGICRQILLRLPAESLIRFRAVSKAWRAVIDDPSFVKAHTNNQLSSDTLLLRNSTGPPFYPLYSFNLDALSFANGPQTIPVTPLKLTRSGLSRLPALPVAACNGLMLIAPVDREINWDRKRNWDSKKLWEIWNPLTYERLELPQPNINIDSEVVGCGLGYDCAADDYKVVVIDYLDHDRKSVSQTHVYSLKSDSWRMIGDCPYDYLSGSCQQGVFLNGALHWGSEYGIIVLDVGTENYRQLPKAPRRGSPDSIQLDALGGCLILSYYRTDDYTKYFDVWMIKDYGAEGSWMKLISLQQCKDNSYLDSDLRPVAYMKNKRQVLLQHYDGYFWFDVESNSVKTVSIHGLSSDSSAQICPGSLVRFHDSCGSVAAKRRMRKRKSKRKMKMKMADTKSAWKMGMKDLARSYFVDFHFFILVALEANYVAILKHNDFCFLKAEHAVKLWEKGKQAERDGISIEFGEGLAWNKNIKEPKKDGAMYWSERRKLYG